jgi:hypothetical protein
VIAVRRYLRYSLSYHAVEKLLAERGITVNHVTIYRCVQTSPPEYIDAARPARHTRDKRWFVDETEIMGRRPRIQQLEPAKISAHAPSERGPRAQSALQR